MDTPLLKKHPEVNLGRTEVVWWVERAQLRVAGYACVEALDKAAERLVPSHLVVEALTGHKTSLSVSGGGPPRSPP